MLQFLQQYASARPVKAAKPKAVAQVLRQTHVGNKLTFSAEDFLRAARSSVATVSRATEIILKGNISTLLHLRGRWEEVERILTNLCKATRAEDLKILRSIKGVGPKTGVPFLAEMGSVEKFSSPKKPIACAGMDPSVCQSGKFIRKSNYPREGIGICEERST